MAQQFKHHFMHTKTHIKRVKHHVLFKLLGLHRIKILPL